MKWISCSILLAGSLALGQVLADGIAIDPGKWEMTSAVELPRMPEPKVTTVEECIDVGELSPDGIAADGLDQGCTMDSNQVSGNTMAWTMTCPSRGSEMRGSWTATSKGDTLSGGGEMVGNFGGQEFVILMTWSGRRVGPCDS
jgi:hypothetical protein